MMVQDRRTGEWYDPDVRFRERMQDPEVLAILRRMRDK